MPQVIAPEFAAEFEQQINSLKREVAELRKLVEMLLVLVDPEDMRAALRLQKTTPSHEVLCALADDATTPQDLFGRE